MEKKMSKINIILIIVFFVLFGFLYVYQRFHWSDAVLELKNEKINVLVAKNIYQQYRGLGKRKTIAPYDGMIFPKSLVGRPTMVMRDMEFPIDIVWFLDGKVVDIAPNVQLEPGKKEFEYTKYYPRTDANLVLELTAGWVDKYGLKIGDMLSVVEE